MSRGYVYILSNPSMPRLLKIGKTTRDVYQRADELHQTGVPTPFKVEEYFETPDCDALEATVHQKLSEHRVSVGREFFRIDAWNAGWIVSQEHFNQVNEWLNEFLPDHDAVACDYLVDIALILERLPKDFPPPNVRIILEDLTAGELQPAIDRLKAKVAEKKAELKVVGEE